jgi:hypothetical protein
MDTVTKKKGGDKTEDTDKMASKNGHRLGREKGALELTQEEIRAEKRRKLTLKVFNAFYEDHQKNSRG